MLFSRFLNKVSRFGIGTLAIGVLAASPAGGLCGDDLEVPQVENSESTPTPPVSLSPYSVHDGCDDAPGLNPMSADTVGSTKPHCK